MSIDTNIRKAIIFTIKLLNFHSFPTEYNIMTIDNHNKLDTILAPNW